MALEANLVRSEITGDGATSTWTDETVYGGSEADRNEVALFLTAYKTDSNQIETAITVESFNPEIVEEFITPNTIDGWYAYYFVIIANWNVAVEYEQYDLVWDTDEEQFYEYINATPSTGTVVTDTDYWEVVTDPTDKIANVGTSSESGNLVYQVINKVVSFQTSICYIKAAAQFAKESCDGDDCGCETRLGKLFIKIRNLFANMGLNESQGLYQDGEKNARMAEKYCDDCGCLTR